MTDTRNFDIIFTNIGRTFIGEVTVITPKAYGIQVHTQFVGADVNQSQRLMDAEPFFCFIPKSVLFKHSTVGRYYSQPQYYLPSWFALKKASQNREASNSRLFCSFCDSDISGATTRNNSNGTYITCQECGGINYI